MTDHIVDITALRLLETFQGRLDVYAKRWLNKTSGKKGYAPSCKNDWITEVCEKFKRKQRGEAMKGACKICPSKEYMPLTGDVLVRQLMGSGPPISMYLVWADETSQTAGIDLDDHTDGDGNSATDEKLSPLDLGSQIVKFAAEYGIHCLLERSGGGKGVHVWFLFQVPVPTSKARALLRGLVRGADVRGEIEIFPKSCRLSKHGLGSALALPCQGPFAVEEDRSVFFCPHTHKPLVPYRHPYFEYLERLARFLESLREKRLSKEGLNAALKRLDAEGHLVPEAQKKTSWTTSKGRSSNRPSSSSHSKTPSLDAVECVFDGCEALRDIRGTATDTGELGHDERLLLAAVFRELPGGRKTIHDILNHCDNYNPDKTDINIDSLEYGPWRCETMQEKGLCGWEGPCPNLKSRGRGASPIAFAYWKPSRVKKRGIESSTSLSSAELRSRFLQRVAMKKQRSQ